MKRFNNTTKFNNEQSLNLILEATLQDLSDAKSQTIRGGSLVWKPRPGDFVAREVPEHRI